MQYILTEAEYNELVSAKQTSVANLEAALDKANKQIVELKRDLTGTVRELNQSRRTVKYLLGIHKIATLRKNSINEFGEVVR